MTKPDTDQNEQARELLGEAWATVEGNAATIEQSPTHTIAPSLHSDTASDQALEVLSQLSGSTTQAIHIEEKLGSGGMGVVWLGDQVTVGRKVAVKTLRDDRHTNASTVKLLREAWVTGALEHPNVVPVYDVGLDADGSPIIVLKRIEGTEWGELITDTAGVRSSFGTDDLLGWNLSILMQVCNAVSFAHSRGIVHRDLKPENVMIGGFGEVYVLDWGIAVSLRDDATGRLPLASNATQMAGTPSYMAPEMLGGGEPRLSERTDVYLLGAILYEIITGDPPHRGSQLMQLVLSVVQSNPRFPSDAPEELAAICRRAMAAEPEDRFDGAESLRLAVQDFLDHRGSANLTTEAAERLEALEELLDSPELRDEKAHRRIYDLFSECRFGYRQALKEWPENDKACEGLRRAIVGMIDYEIGQNDPKAAALLLDELQEPQPDLVERVAEARRRKDRELERIAHLEEMGRDLDPRIGRKTRTIIGAGVGLLLTVGPLLAQAYPGRATHLTTMAAMGLYLAAAAGLGFWGRTRLRQTRISRHAVGGLMLALGGTIMTHAGAWLLDLPLAPTVTIRIMIWAAISAMLSLTVDRRLWLMVGGYVAGFFAAALWPAHVYYAVAGSHAAMLVTVLYIYKTGPPSDPIH